MGGLLDDPDYWNRLGGLLSGPGGPLEVRRAGGLGAVDGVQSVVPAGGFAPVPMKAGLENLMQTAREHGIDLVLSGSGNKIVVSKIVVPKEMRGQGVGSSVMKAITAFADANGKTLALNPSTDFGGNKAGLERFYGRQGFESNLGRKRDFEITEAMRRYPKK